MTLRDVKREFREVPLVTIDEPELKSRVEINDAGLIELAHNIKQNGLINPICVVPANGRYEIIAGHRRYLAAQLAGFVAVECFIYPDKTAVLEALKYGENRFREELKPTEEAYLFDRLLERDYGGDVDRLCIELGEKRAYVEDRLLLLRGHEDVFRALERSEINLSVARELNKCPDGEHVRHLLSHAISGGSTRAVVSGWIEDWKRLQRGAAPADVSSSSSSAPAPIANNPYFTCIVCGGQHDINRMTPMNVHDYCWLATLQRLLAAFHAGEIRL